MECINFVGLLGSGKTSFYKDRFFATHVRIGLDLLKTRHREQRFLETCLATGQRFVVDNTNPTPADRVRYIKTARNARCSISGYYFQSRIEDCLHRNRGRAEREHIPDAGILAASSRLELPTLSEGFDTLYYVKLDQNRFVVEEWRDEV